MTAAEHLAFWEDRERATNAKARKKKRQGFRTAADDALLVLPLYRRVNLTRFLLMEEFADYPHVQVFERVVEQWDQEDLEDFRRIRVARSEVRRKHNRLRTANTLAGQVMSSMVAEVEKEMSGSRG